MISSNMDHFTKELARDALKSYKNKYINCNNRDIDYYL